ncbi:MAG: Ig-like domain-containing protein [Woeseiaceae bacterium]|nr:Ig-like domain-containing protein [Woeseiaceae bacterium]
MIDIASCPGEVDDNLPFAGNAPCLGQGVMQNHSDNGIRVAVLVLGGLLGACEVQTFDDAASEFAGDAPVPPPPSGINPNFSEIQASVLTPSCATANCHSGGSPPEGLSLEAASSYAMLVGVPSNQDAAIDRVRPGDPDNSYLVQKIEGTASSGGVMPPAGALDQATIDTIRQWITDGAIDDRAPAAGPVKVSSLSPAPSAALTAAPTTIVAGFDRDLDATTVNLNTFTLTASVDGVFGNGNDLAISAAQISVPLGNPRSAIFDLSGVAMADDEYEVRLSGSAPSMIMDLNGNALDGEFAGGFPSGNGVAGGDFVSRFTISTPLVLGPTLPQIQAIVFGPTCAVGGCHTGGGAILPGVMDLSSEQSSFDNLVNVAALQVGGGAALRVTPGDPDNSYLIQKLEGNQMIGNQMPPSGPLAQSVIDEIRLWISNGAMP